ncbi:hypothetical protein [Antribacter gilvus]|uniref:hypothetical protein n=1 Tax=Antribacter gilvus TaxID=2304675 RepID=UPI000F769BEA|nr:hypothetical protein [Antribacter gilvus]
MSFYLRGALVEFMATPLIPIPNIIVFQYNPESMSHGWSQPESPAAGANGTTSSPMAVTSLPGETFSFSLSLDAADTIADGAASAAIAKVTGVSSRLAALEMLLHPASATEGGLLGTVTAGIGSLLGAGGGGAKAKVPQNTLSTVLLVWGPGRIVPVRVTSLTITETIYDTLLNPTKATVQVGLKVLTKTDLQHSTDDAVRSLGLVAVEYMNGLRQALAVANLVNSTESVLGMLPV